jgi:hypothetical protein
MDYQDDVVLMGHDGSGHSAIAESKTKVRSLYVYHGKVGKGLLSRDVLKAWAVTTLCCGGMYILNLLSLMSILRVAFFASNKIPIIKY